MHETSFFDASFVVFIGFLVFMGLSLKYGYRKAMGALDQEIETIQATLDQALETLKAAETRVQQEHILERQLGQEIKTIQEAAEAHIVELRQQTDAELQVILANKNATIDSTLDMLRHTLVLELREKLTGEASQKLTDILLTKIPRDLHDRINSQAIHRLKTLLEGEKVLG
jgi:F0F1-type ATP synthase membrane subunit b/b'